MGKGGDGGAYFVFNVKLRYLHSHFSPHSTMCDIVTWHKAHRRRGRTWRTLVVAVGVRGWEKLVVMVPWPASHGEAELSCLCIIFAAPPDIVTSLQEQQKKSIKKNHLCTRSLKRRIDVHNGADTHLNLFLFHFFFFIPFSVPHPFSSQFTETSFFRETSHYFFHAVPKTSQHTPTDRWQIHDTTFTLPFSCWGRTVFRCFADWTKLFELQSPNLFWFVSTPVPFIIIIILFYLLNLLKISPLIWSGYNIFLVPHIWNMINL